MCLLDLLLLPIDFLFWGFRGVRSTLFPQPVDYSQEDIPPDGSMLLSSGDPPDYRTLPPGFSYYEFGPGCDEDDPVAIKLGLQIIESLCQSRTVLTAIEAYKSYDRKGREIPSEFLRFYVDLLKKTKPECSVYQEGRMLVYLITGYDRSLLPFYHSDRAKGMGSCDFSFYLFPGKEPVKDAKEAFEKVQAERFAMRLDYMNYGPTSLEVAIDPRTENVEGFFSTVQQICDKEGVLLVKGLDSEEKEAPKEGDGPD